MLYKPVDFSEEKKELEKTLGDLHQGENESTKEPESINFQKVSRDIEEFIDAATRGLTPLCPRPIQESTLICKKIFDRIKTEKSVPKSIIEDFLNLVEQDLGNPSYKYLKKLIFKGEK